MYRAAGLRLPAHPEQQNSPQRSNAITPSLSNSDRAASRTEDDGNLPDGSPNSNPPQDLVPSAVPQQPFISRSSTFPHPSTLQAPTLRPYIVRLAPANPRIPAYYINPVAFEQWAIAHRLQFSLEDIEHIPKDKYHPKSNELMSFNAQLYRIFWARVHREDDHPDCYLNEKLVRQEGPERCPRCWNIIMNAQIDGLWPTFEGLEMGP